MDRLSNRTFASLPKEILRPAYDRNQVRPGILHLGVGAFHRAHQAVYVDDVLAAGDLGWGIVAASLRSPDTRDALAPQDWLYTLAIRDASGDRLRVIGSILDGHVLTDNPKPLFKAKLDPNIRIVSLTVTEKGYCHDPATGDLDQNHPDIVHDCQNPHAPRSVAGILVETFARRKAAGAPPLSILCCDNLPANGRVIQNVVTQMAGLRDPELAAYIFDKIAFPSTMVDRIAPATTDADRIAISSALGVQDAWPVMTEPFSQWVIEDHFASGRPDFGAVGAILTKDVEAFEKLKLRLLNASHSAMAYLGYLSGYETISEVIADPQMRRMVIALMDEVEPTLRVPAGTDVAAYRRSLLDRFANPALKHRTWQIAMDGSQKLPQRLLATLRERLSAGAPIGCLSLAVAGWMRYVSGLDEQGRTIDVRDPLSARLRTIADKAGQEPSRLAPALLEVQEVFGTDLRRNERFVAEVTGALGKIYAFGAKGAVAGL